MAEFPERSESTGVRKWGNGTALSKLPADHHAFMLPVSGPSPSRARDTQYSLRFQLPPPIVEHGFNCQVR